MADGRSALGRVQTGPATSRIVERVRPRILLAEDDPELRRLWAHTLREIGYQVAEIADGAKLMVQLGLDAPERGVPGVDAIVTDVRMPGVTGLEVLEALRDAGWRVPVLVITAFADTATHEAAGRAGATVLDKPVGLEEFRSAVRAMAPLPPEPRKRAA